MRVKQSIRKLRSDDPLEKMDMFSLNEELLILRLPPRLAARIGARIDRQDRAKGEHSSLLRRRRKQKDGKKSNKSEIVAFVNAVWGEDGAPDYDSLSEVEDLLDLDGLQEDETYESDEDDERQKEGKDKEAEETKDEDCDVEYWRVDGNNFIFKYGEDEYYATLVQLPCILEAQKTTDTSNLYKTADIGSMLLVHDVKTSSGLPRPIIDPDDLHHGNWAHGITPPMRRVLPDRFAKVSPVARREGYKLDMGDVKQADDLLHEFKELVLQMHRKAEAPPAPTKKKGPIPLPSSTVFVHEELIDAEAWMEYADDVIVVEPGEDRFRSSTKAEQQKARENKRSLDEKRQQAAGVRSAVGSFPLMGLSTNAPRPPYMGGFFPPGT